MSNLPVSFDGSIHQSSPMGKGSHTNSQRISTWNGFAPLFSKEKIAFNLKSRHIWNSFFDVYKYSAPQTVQEMRRRTEQNISTYYLQYCTIFGVILICTILSNGWGSIFVFSLVISGILGIFYGWPRRTHALIPPRPLDGIQISWHAAVSLWAFVSILFILATGTWIVFPTSLGFSTFVIGAHCVLHSCEPDLAATTSEEIV